MHFCSSRHVKLLEHKSEEEEEEEEELILLEDDMARFWEWYVSTSRFATCTLDLSLNEESLQLGKTSIVASSLSREVAWYHRRGTNPSFPQPFWAGKLRQAFST